MSSNLSIIVPTYNEKNNIRPLIERLDKALEHIDFEILFVDDSTDDTPALLAEVSSESDHVSYIHRDNEKGLATAVLLGFRKSNGKYLACMDADLQHPPEILLPMYVAMENGADICIPSRLIPGGSDGGLNLWRKFVSSTARNIGKCLLPCLRKISDPTSGLFMFRRQIIENADMRPIGWKIMIELLATATYTNIIQIPYTFCERQSGTSKIDGKVTLQYLQQCFDLRKRYIKNRINVVNWASDETTAKTESYIKSRL